MDSTTEDLTSTLLKTNISHQASLSQLEFEFQTPPIWTWIVVTFLVIFLSSAAFLPSFVLGPLEVFREFMYAVGHPQLWQSCFYVAAFLHVLEATFALYLAQKVDPQRKAYWFWQTLYLGYFSLSLLLQKAKL